MIYNVNSTLLYPFAAALNVDHKFLGNDIIHFESATVFLQAVLLLLQ